MRRGDDAVSKRSRGNSIPAAEFGIGPNHRLDVEEALVHSDLEDARYRVLDLAGRIAIGATDPELANPHVADGLRNDFEGQPVTRVADQVLIAIIGFADESALDMDGIGAPTPGADVGIIVQGVIPGSAVVPKLPGC